MEQNKGTSNDDVLQDESDTPKYLIFIDLDHCFLWSHWLCLQWLTCCSESAWEVAGGFILEVLIARCVLLNSIEEVTPIQLLQLQLCQI